MNGQPSGGSAVAESLVPFSPQSLRVRLLLLVVVSVVLVSRAEAHEGWGIVVDATGQVYFGDIPANVIWKISVEGKLEKAVIGKHSHALVLDSADNLYGTNPHLTLPVRSVWRLSPDRHLTDAIPPTENLPLGLQSFTMDGAGNMYSANARSARKSEVLLLKRSPDGRISTIAGSTSGHADGSGSQAMFRGIDGMAWGPDGLLYLTDGPYVRRVDPDGTVSTLGGDPLTERKWDEDLLGIAVGAGGNVYAADYAGRRILRISPAGAVSTILRTGSFWAPTGIAVAPGGLYLLEHLRMPLGIMGDLAVGPYLRVRKMSPDGRVIELARLWGRRSFAAGAGVAAVAAVLVWARVFRGRNRGSRASDQA